LAGLALRWRRRETCAWNRFFCIAAGSSANTIFRFQGTKIAAQGEKGICEGEVKKMARTLYVGNLPWSTSAEDLAEAFSSYGEVLESRVIRDRQTGRSRGFGFVEVADEDAEAMIAALDGKELGGRIITVREARAREED
jgi:RNA recognition motif-containing protein